MGGIAMGKLRCVRVLIWMGVLLWGMGISLGYPAVVDRCSPKIYDYGDAPYLDGKGYDLAWNYHNPHRKYQILGDKWNSEKGPRKFDKSDDGVSWQTSSNEDLWLDDGWGNESEIQNGQYIKFKFTVKRKAKGTHKLDYLSAWMDWNRDYDWKGERIVNTKWRVSRYKNNEYTYISDAFFLTEEMVGLYWLRARVACKGSLNKKRMSYKGYLSQGEVEDYGIQITSAVPLPGAALLMGSGLLGVLAVGRRRRLDS